MVWRRIAFHLVATAGIGLFATVLGGLAHAVIIVPVWNQLGPALPFAALITLSMTWAVPEVAKLSRGGWQPARGLLVGSLLWTALLPMTAFEAVLRMSRLHDGSSWLQAGVQLVLAAASGALIGWLVGRDWRSGLAMSVAAVAFALALGGAVPVTDSLRSMLLFVSFLPVAAIAGAGVALLHETFGLASRPGNPGGS